MLPNPTILPEEDKSFRESALYARRIAVLTHDRSVGPCDVTLKSDLEKIVQEISSKEKYLNLLSPLSIVKNIGFYVVNLLPIVTNAGISGPKAPPDSKSADVLHDKIWSGESVEDWESVLKTNGKFSTP